MKSIKLNEARGILKKNGCHLVRTGSHEIWGNQWGQTFALPCCHMEVSPGVLRKMFRFIEGKAQ